MLTLHIGEETIPVIFGNDELLKKELQDKGLNPIIVNPPTALPIFFPAPDLVADNDIKYKDSDVDARVVELTPEVTTYHGSRVNKLHAKTLVLLQMVLPDVKWPIDHSKRSYVVQHLLGLIDLTLKLADASAVSQLSVVWKYPESGLHPKHQACLGDVLINLQAYLQNKETI